MSLRSRTVATWSLLLTTAVIAAGCIASGAGESTSPSPGGRFGTAPFRLRPPLRLHRRPVGNADTAAHAVTVAEPQPIDRDRLSHRTQRPRAPDQHWRRLRPDRLRPDRSARGLGLRRRASHESRTPDHDLPRPAAPQHPDPEAHPGGDAASPRGRGCGGPDRRRRPVRCNGHRRRPDRNVRRQCRGRTARRQRLRAVRDRQHHRLDQATIEARAKLRVFVQQVGDLAKLVGAAEIGDGGVFQATAMRLIVTLQPDQPVGASPAPSSPSPNDLVQPPVAWPLKGHAGVIWSAGRARRPGGTALRRRRRIGPGPAATAAREGKRPDAVDQRRRDVQPPGQAAAAR